MSLKAKILGKRRLPSEPVTVPEWDITDSDGVRVRGLSARERDDFEASRVEQKGKSVKLNLSNTRARLVALTLVGPDGKRVFDDSDVAALGEDNAAVLDRLYAVAMRLSGMSEKDVEAEAEALRGNPGNSSPTA